MNFLLTVVLFIAFIPRLFFTLPQCTKHDSDEVNKWTMIVTHAVAFTLVLLIINIF